MKKLLALLCVLAVLLSVSVVSFSAVMPPDVMGSLFDERISVRDATAIQKHIADIEPLNGLQRYLADVDNDIRITVKDATAIQKYVAGLDGYYSVGEYFWKESGERFYCSHSSGRAWVGEEITFSTNGLGRYYRKEVYKNSLYVNGELVAEGNTNDFTYVFTEPGVYEVVMRGRTSYDETYGYSYKWSNFEVTMPASEDEVVIKNLECPKNPDSNMFYISEGPFDFSVTAQGGSGEYEYLFKLDDLELTSGFVKNNTITIYFADYLEPVDEWGYDYGEHTISVYVRDALDNSKADVYDYNIFVEKHRPPA